MRRTAGRVARTVGLLPPLVPPPPERHDGLLADVAGNTLAELDRACAGAGPEALARFRELDDDLWALLLTQAYDAYPNIRALLPDVPEPGLQELWNGVSGAALAAQSLAFYRVLRERAAARLPGGLEEARVLDFGCGWGRLTRFLARDAAPGRLYGCDPVELILDICRQTRVPAVLARSDVRSPRLPFDERFDLAFAFSVFTHLSEPAHRDALAALHGGLRPGGLLVVTVRPSGFLGGGPGYRFEPHPAEASHPQYEGGEMHYGETVVPLSYVREHWAPRFELLSSQPLVADLQQIVLTLRRSEGET